jgi:hypothetical protein
MVCNNCGAPPTSAQATWCTKCGQPLSDEKSTRRPGLGVSATPPTAVSAPNTPREFGEGAARIALRKAGRIASPLASYLRHLLAEAGQHLGRMGLDMLDAGRLLLLLRARRSTPERAGQIEGAIAQLRKERANRWSAWRAIPVRRQIEIRGASLLLGLIVLLAAHSYFTASGASSSPGSIEQLMGQARAEARKWHPDAVLVQIELSDFGFAMGPSGIPDVTKAGPPGVVQFHFLSFSAHDAMRVVAQPKLTPDQLKFLASRGSGLLRVEHLSTPFSPYTLPIPESFVDPRQAIAQAQKDIGPECGGAKYPGCALVSDAELHVFWSGQGESGIPVWRISFGQNPRTLQTVTREVSATSGELVALIDKQRGSIFSEPGQRLEDSVLQGVGNDFDSVWRAVNLAMAKHDVLYKPYAVSLIAYLRDNRGPGSTVYVSEAEFQYARITPSFYWDDRMVHVKWAGSTAVVDISPAIRRSAPGEPVPRTMEAGNLPAENATLRKILNAFPEGYAEQYTTWERGCENEMTVSPFIKQWECGVLVPITHRTDQVYIWMTRQGNPYWESAAAPLQSEHTLISTNAPPNAWVWWTRLKRPDQWQYVIVNAASGLPTTTAGVCTVPPDTAGSRPAAVEACG